MHIHVVNIILGMVYHQKYGMPKMQNVHILKKIKSSYHQSEMIWWYFYTQNQRKEAIVTKIIKTLGIENSRLNVITAGIRMPIADFSGRIEIYEKQKDVSILGRHCKGEKKIYASFILCDNIEYCSDDEIHSGKVYESVGDVQGERSCEKLIFSGLRFEDSDPVTGNITFEITDLELIRKMLTM